MIASRKKLGDLCNLVTKGTTPTSVGFDFAEHGVPFLRIQNISGSTVSLDDVLYIEENTHNALGRSKIRPGDFLITIAGTIGRTAIVPPGFPESNCNQAVAILRFDEAKLWPKFLLYWLSTEDATGQISGRKVTATISNLSLGQIKELEIPLPPLSEQKRIADILDKADAIRRKRQQAIHLADDFLLAVFLDMFGDPATNPKGWEVSSLDQHLEFLTSGSRGWAKYYSDSGSKFIRIQNVGKNKLLLTDMAYVNAPKGAEAARTKIQTGDVLLSITADLGRSSVVTSDIEDGYVNQHLAILRLKKDELNSRYLSAYLSSDAGVRQFFVKNKSAVKAGINFSDIRSLEIQVPPISLQRSYENLYERVMGFQLKQSENLDVAEATFSSLSQKAFSGQL
ncbi:restriction endonuclease subunit S [Pseudomonas sp. Ga0074129]|uniref:restriction endonuclease subunit S n=1 Tax=Pseudomonas sp. Ga0074129 TaxID=1752219 RepID=UPI000A7889F7|nr:restriction endonuclease subunit S [Pseudomonas sp. Ga0074129]